VSNDELKDHQFMMNSARDLYRWKDRHAVKFSFGPWDPAKQWREPLLTFPSAISQRIQAVKFQTGWGLCMPHGSAGAEAEAEAEGAEAEGGDGDGRGGGEVETEWTAIIPNAMPD
jgi:hypothetical protein